MVKYQIEPIFLHFSLMQSYWISKMVSFVLNLVPQVAMKLHTKEQAPKEGQQESKPKPKAVS